MKFKWIVLVALVASMAVPVVADAHTLPTTTARAKARSATRTIVEGLDWDISGYGVGSCRRRSAHSIDCNYWVETYDDIHCDSVVRVRFVNSWSYRTTYSFPGDPDCY